MEAALFWTGFLSFCLCFYLVYRVLSKKYVGGKISYKTKESKKKTVFDDWTTDFYYFHCVVHDENGNLTSDVKMSVPEDVYNQFEVNDTVTVKI